jgi:hypothetical protein
MQVRASEQAIKTFIAHSDIAARDLLLPLADVVMALSVLLWTKRTLEGAEIDRWNIRPAVREALAASGTSRPAQWPGLFLTTYPFSWSALMA